MKINRHAVNDPAPESPIPTGHGSAYEWHFKRRQFLNRFAMGIGGIALADLLKGSAGAAPAVDHGVLGQPHFPAKAKRIIYLFMSGGPSQLDLFDYKPRLTGMSGNQSSIPLVGSPFKFAQHGQSGAWFSELLPHTATLADDLCVVRSMFTEAINHGPGVTYFQTGSQIPGRPSMGAWLSYGLGQENANLPSFVVLITKGKSGQPLGSHLWGSGFLAPRHQGVLFRASKDPVLYLGNPQGVSADSRRLLLDRMRELHEHQFESTPDAEIQSRIDQYEMAFRMQTSIPEVTDLSHESPETLEAYGPDVRTPGTFAANCLQARRLAEQGVRFIQLYHQDWDHHGGLPTALPKLCKETDHASYAARETRPERDRQRRSVRIQDSAARFFEDGRENSSGVAFSERNGCLLRRSDPRYCHWWQGAGQPGCWPLRHHVFCIYHCLVRIL